MPPLVRTACLAAGVRGTGAAAPGRPPTTDALWKAHRDPQACARLFKTAAQPNAAMYVPLLTAYQKARWVGECLGAYEQLCREERARRAARGRSRGGNEADNAHMNQAVCAVANACGAGGAWEKSVAVLEAFEYPKDEVTWGMHLKALGRGGLWADAVAMLAAMQAPTAVQGNIVAGACLAAGEHAAAAEVLGGVLATTPREAVAPSTVSLGITAAAAAGDLNRAAWWLSHHAGACDSAVFSTYLTHLSDHVRRDPSAGTPVGKFVAHAVDMMDALGVGIEPATLMAALTCLSPSPGDEDPVDDLLAYPAAEDEPAVLNAALAAYARGGDYPRLMCLWDRLDALGVPRDVAAHTCVMQATLAAGFPERALAMFREMPAVDEQAVTVAVEVHMRLGLLEEAAQLLQITKGGGAGGSPGADGTADGDEVDRAGGGDRGYGGGAGDLRITPPPHAVTPPLPRGPPSPSPVAAIFSTSSPRPRGAMRVAASGRVAHDDYRVSQQLKLHAANGRWDAALHDYREYRRLGGSSPAIAHQTAVACVAARRVDEARDVLVDAPRCDTLLLCLLCEVCIRSGDTAPLLDVVRRCSDDDDDDDGTIDFAAVIRAARLTAPAVGVEIYRSLPHAGGPAATAALQCCARMDQSALCDAAVEIYNGLAQPTARDTGLALRSFPESRVDGAIMLFERAVDAEAVDGACGAAVVELCRRSGPSGLTLALAFLECVDWSVYPRAHIAFEEFMRHAVMQAQHAMAREAYAMLAEPSEAMTLLLAMHPAADGGGSAADAPGLKGDLDPRTLHNIATSFPAPIHPVQGAPVPTMLKLPPLRP